MNNNSNVTGTQNVPQYRTINECLSLIRERDSNSAITYYTIKSLIKQGILHPLYSGSKALIDYVELKAVLNGANIG